MLFTSLPIAECVLDEIALEGLEGVTIEGLWKRLSVRLKLTLPLQTKFIENVWNFVKQSKQLQFFQLPVEREPLKIFNRFEFMESTLGALNEPVRTNRCVV